MKTIMAFGAHHDDIELHCGGTIAKYAQKNWNVIYAVASTTPHYSPFYDDKGEKVYLSNNEVIETREKEAEAGAKVLGASEIHFFDFRSLYWYKGKTLERIHFDGKKYTSKDLALLEQEIPGREYIISAARSKEAVDFLSGFISEKEVDIILTHCADDKHWEHYATANFMLSAVKSFAAGKKRTPLLFHWDFGSGGPVNFGFTPTRYVDISETVDLKCQAVSVFKSQTTDHKTDIFVNHVRNRARAYGKLFGIEYAEVFMDGCVETDGFNNSGRLLLPETYDPSKAKKGLK